jgi:steroid 5-alpha reductase family enzyme
MMLNSQNVTMPPQNQQPPRVSQPCENDQHLQQIQHQQTEFAYLVAIVIQQMLVAQEEASELNQAVAHVVSIVGCFSEKDVSQYLEVFKGEMHL